MIIDATFWVMISFFIFLGLLAYFKIPEKIKTTLEQNISNIKNQIDEANKLKEDAKNILTLEKKFDLIFHLGEYSRVEESLKKIDFVLENNSMPIINILKFAKKCKAKLIYAGSSTKYADKGDNKFQSPYAFSKWQNSELVKLL